MGKTAQERGFDILHEELGFENDPKGRKFDELTGKAANCGTLTVEALLCFIRPYVVQGEVPDLDAYAHMILDL
jgi:hypothetical protein